LALAPALAWPGVTAALPEADPLAEVCATAPTDNSPAVIAAIKNILMFKFASFLCLQSMKIWDLRTGFL
jgi:hypothetical protein